MSNFHSGRAPAFCILIGTLVAFALSCSKTPGRDKEREDHSIDRASEHSSDESQPVENQGTEEPSDEDATLGSEQEDEGSSADREPEQVFDGAEVFVETKLPEFSCGGPGAEGKQRRQSREHGAG